ncbi:P-selectin glycoprotein ligand 1 [Embiotoca jacksoni]|uniref:P-selectin glycoprotein ligand 1 n=1 Tax=Embiotoca jacksoni TaxID=100190 RepID=UPI003703ED5E
MLLSMKMFRALLWVTCVLLTMESMTAFSPETNNITFTVEPNRSPQQLTTAHGLHNKSDSEPTDSPADVSAAAAAESTVVPTVDNMDATGTNKTHSSNTVGLTATSTTSNLDQSVSYSSDSVSTDAGEARPSQSMKTTETAKSTEDQFHQQSATTFTDITASVTTSAASSSTTSASSPLPTTITEPATTSELSSTTSNSLTPASSTETLSSPSAVTTTTITTNPSSEASSVFNHASSVFNHASSPVTTTQASKSSTELSYTSQSISATSSRMSSSQFADSAGSSSTSPSVSTGSPSSSTVVSSSAAGILVPREPTGCPTPTTKSAPATEPREVTNAPPSTEAQPCSPRGVVNNCLIAIASLAGLATVFMVSTVVLCAKLSTRKYKRKKPQQATEMMCISALLPETSYTYTRQRNPVANGILVIPRGGDSDEDGGDNLTLSSFLPENDRFV